MIDYRKDRIDYGEQLSPPEGYKLEMAITTSYSLDLYALLSIPVALFYSKNLDGTVNDSRMDILDAIQKTSSCVKVYCQKGKIQVPKSHNKMVAFIDDCITEVVPKDAYTSFHSKIWVMRFVRNGVPAVYRFFIMSRNLTFDRSWDLAYFSEGEVGKAKIDTNKPLINFIQYLKEESDFNNSKQFIEELAKVSFESDFETVMFHPMGIKNQLNPLPLMCTNLLVVSPFIHENTLKRLKEQSTGKRYLFGRKEELNRLPKHSFDGYETFFFSDRIIDGEDYFDEGAEYETLPQNLHAKLFVCDNVDTYTWFLGSANCSDAAFDRNIEFLIELKSKENKYGVHSIKKELLGNDSGREFFEPFVFSEQTTGEEDIIKQDIRRILHELIFFLDNKSMTAECEASTDMAGKFDVIIQVKNRFHFKTDIYDISFTVYGREEYKSVTATEEIRFEGINLVNLSPFLHWKVVHKESSITKEFMTKMDIKLPENRRDSIFRSIIENKEKFFQFLQFLLGKDGGNISFIDTILQKNGFGNNSGFIWENETPILEELLINMSRNPERIVEIDRIIEKLSSNKEDCPIPNEFLEFWEVFKPSING